MTELVDENLYCIKCGAEVQWTWFCRDCYLHKELSYAAADLIDVKEGKDPTGVHLDIAISKVLSCRQVLDRKGDSA